MDFFDNVLDLRQYADALDQERTKIQVFHRELPLCFELVTRAIGSCRQQLSGVSTGSSEHTSSDDPVLEEFIPIKKSSDNYANSHFEIDEDEQSKPEKIEMGRLDWLKSAQLWNQTPDPPVLEDGSKKTTSSVIEVKKNGGGGAFQPFQKEKIPFKTEAAAAVAGKTGNCSPVAEATASSTAETGGNSKREDKESRRAQRKQRRCWSAELHRLFVHALQQLGGAYVATPKQIRELMKVDGLTNDEVKSHLQKYRLYAKRPTNSAMQDNGRQFMVVGSLWVPPQPPPKYTAVAETGKMRNGIYAPVATALRRPKTGEEGKGHGGGVVQLNSPASTTSSTLPAAAA